MLILVNKMYNCENVMLMQTKPILHVLQLTFERHPEDRQFILFLTFHFGITKTDANVFRVHIAGLGEKTVT